MYYTQEQIDRANQADLVLFLQSQGDPLERAGQEYRWKRHDSLIAQGNKWYRHSVSRGGGPIAFIMEFFGKSFTEAVELLTGEKGAAPPQDSPQFRLPPRSPDNRTASNYLTAARRLAEIAERTGCAVFLIGHLNRAAGGQSAYRGLDSIGFTQKAMNQLLFIHPCSLR